MNRAAKRNQNCYLRMQICAIWIGACIIAGYVCHNTSWCESDLHVHLVIIGRIIVSLSLGDSRPSYYVLFYSCYVRPFSLDTLHLNRYHSLIFISFIPFSPASLGCFQNWNWIIFIFDKEFIFWGLDIIAGKIYTIESLYSNYTLMQYRSKKYVIY